MTNRLLDAGLLFQTLLDAAKPEGSTVAADLDVESFDAVPFITHSWTIAQDRNGPGLWSVMLTINLFLETTGAFDTVAGLYEAIHAWGEDPDAAIVPGVGAVESVEDSSAIQPVSGEVLMNTKAVRHYQGTFEITARVH